jgi:hypothetical protein
MINENNALPPDSDARLDLRPSTQLNGVVDPDHRG